jgi:hypothetical protein
MICGYLFSATFITTLSIKELAVCVILLTLLGVAKSLAELLEAKK